MRFLVLLLLSLSMSSLFHGTDSSKEAPLSGEGGFQPIKNLTDPHIVDIAKFAVSEHNKENKTNLIFQRIVSGKYQVVAGTNYVLVIEAKIGAAKLSHYYEAEVYENLNKKLKLIYFKPLLRQKKPPVSEDPSPLPGGAVGAYQDIKNLTDPHIVDIAKFAVSEHNKENKTNLIFQRIVSGKYQVVAGTNYVLVIEAKIGAAKLSHYYEAEVYENLNKKLKLIYFKPLLRQKKPPVSEDPSPLPGGAVGAYQDIKNLTDPHIVDIAKFAVSEHNKESKTNLIFQRIVSGKYQVVAGTNYVLVIEAKIGAAKLSRYYEAKVYENLSMKLQLIYFKPLLRQKKPPVSEDPSPLPGGYQDIKNLTDPHIQHIAKFAVSEHNKESKTNLIFKTIVSGKYQVVAGKNYVLVIEVKDGQYLYRYETKVFENLKMNLQLIYFKKDLGPLSAWKPVENLEKDKHILEIARNAVLEHNKELAKANKYNDDHHDAGALVFEKVVSGETQEVGDHEGVKYRLVISANGAKYEVSVWEKITSFKPLP